MKLAEPLTRMLDGSRPQFGGNFVAQRRRTHQYHASVPGGSEPLVRIAKLPSALRGVLLAAVAAVVWILPLTPSADAQNLAPSTTPEDAAGELGIDLGAPLTLEDCVDLALRVHPDIRVAVSDLHRATAGVRQTRAALWPQFSAYHNYRLTEQPTTTAVIGGAVIPVGGGRSESKTSGVTATVSVYQTSRFTQLRQSEIYADSARAGIKEARRRLAYTIGQAYYDQLAADRLVGVNEAAEAAAQDHVGMVQAQIDAEDAAPVEIHAVRAQLQSTRLDLVTTRNQAAIARTTLWSALGEPEGPVGIVDIWQEPSSLPDLDECIEAAFLYRPDLEQAEAGVRAAKLGAKLARQIKHPQVNLGGTAEYGRYDGDGGTSWTIYGSVQQSIFSGGANSAALDQAKATVQSSDAQLDRLEQSIRLEVETSWLRLRQSAESIAAADAALVEAEASVDAAERRYLADAGILLEVTDAQVNATRSAISVVRSHYDYNTALAELRYAMGLDPTDAPIIEE